ncbi:MAG: hypothetical protein J7623_25355 [Chitinophaga sp.]|uniref:hypothetical protein n=1 Tax=Chitinophaga sp. TaxID=1869181 RepID=UPI001B111AC2|nr:hypothetical protein [Chitinophaga sp.]MBO9731994.1 hypothetical protein [Chitinophaga sp.]
METVLNLGNYPLPMEYYFTKRMIVAGYHNGFANTGKHQLFSVYTMEEQLVGEVYYHPSQGFFYIGEMRMNIKRAGESFFQRMCIVDAYTDKIMGEFRHDGWRALENGSSILLNDQRYTFRKIKLKSSLFDRDTWGYYKYQIRKDRVEFTYSFHIGERTSWKEPITDRAFEGVVETTGVLEGDDLIALFAGFYSLGNAMEDGFSS